jgi:acyl-CoA thioesterase II
LIFIRCRRGVALDLLPWETRAAVDLNATITGPPQFEVWMRTPAVDH